MLYILSICLLLLLSTYGEYGTQSTSYRTFSPMDSSVVLNNTTDIEIDSFIVRAYIQDNATEQYTAWFEWGTTINCDNKTANQTVQTNKTFSAELNNLSINTTYYYRAIATNTNKTLNSSTANYTTPSYIHATENNTPYVIQPKNESINISYCIVEENATISCPYYTSGTPGNPPLVLNISSYAFINGTIDISGNDRLSCAGGYVGGTNNDGWGPGYGYGNQGYGNYYATGGSYGTQGQSGYGGGTINPIYGFANLSHWSNPSSVSEFVDYVNTIDENATQCVGGSGGGGSTYSSSVKGGGGGGALKIQTSYLQIAGSIASDGGAAGSIGGGGSGGTIWLISEKINLTGFISADRGPKSTNDGARGGHGRIRIDYTDPTSTINITNSNPQPYITAELNAITLNATNVNNSSMTIHGMYEADNSCIAEVWFEWGKNESLNNTTTKTTIAGNTTHSVLLEDLEQGTLYFYRLCILGNDGIIKGEIKKELLPVKKPEQFTVRLNLSLQDRFILDWSMPYTTANTTTYIEKNTVEEWNRTEGTIIHNGSTMNCQDFSIEDEYTIYYYKAWSYIEKEYEGNTVYVYSATSQDFNRSKGMRVTANNTPYIIQIPNYLNYSSFIIEENTTCILDNDNISRYMTVAVDTEATIDGTLKGAHQSGPLELEINGTVTVSTQGFINFSAQGIYGYGGGYDEGQGPGTTQSSVGVWTSGAGHATRGEAGYYPGGYEYGFADLRHWNNASYNKTSYTGVTYTQCVGGSGAGHCLCNAGAGGGAIKILAQDIKILGNISVDGSNSVTGCSKTGGSGSGGTIWIDGGVVNISGLLTAEGGTTGRDGSDGHIRIDAAEYNCSGTISPTPYLREYMPLVSNETPANNAPNIGKNPIISVTVLDNQGDLKTVRLFEEVDNNWTLRNNYTGSPLSNGTFNASTVNVTKGNTTYNWSIYVEDMEGNDVTYYRNFTTRIFQPSITLSETSSDIQETTACLGANLTADGGDICTIWFEYGIGEMTNSSESGNATAGIWTKMISDLTPTTTYIYRAVCTNSNSTVYSQNDTFTTQSLPSPPIIHMPMNNTKNASTYGLLFNCTLLDPDDEPMNCTFFWANHTAIKTINNTQNNSEVAFNLSDYISPPYLKHNTTYLWYLNISDGQTIRTSSTFQFTTRHAADFDGDQRITHIEVSIVIFHYGESCQPGIDPWDLNDDGTVNPQDISILVSTYGRQ